MVGHTSKILYKKPVYNKNAYDKKNRYNDGNQVMYVYIGTRKSKKTDISSPKRFGQRCFGPKMSWHSMNRTNVRKKKKRPYYCIVAAFKFEFYLFMFIFF